MNINVRNYKYRGDNMEENKAIKKSSFEKTKSASEKMEEYYNRIYKTMGIGSFANRAIITSLSNSKVIENTLRLNEFASNEEKLRLAEVAGLNANINNTCKLLRNNNFNLYSNVYKNDSLRLLQSSASKLISNYCVEALNLKSSKLLYGQQYMLPNIINIIQSIENINHGYDIFQRMNIDKLSKLSINNIIFDNKFQTYINPLLKSEKLSKTLQLQKNQLNKILGECSKFYFNDKLINLSNVAGTLESNLKMVLSNITEVKVIRDLVGKRFEKSINILKRFGWWGISSLSFKIYIEIEKQENLLEKKEVDEIICNFYNKDNFKNLESLLAKWKQNKYFERISEILDDAIYAHKNGKYTLSIPALMPNVEGIIRCFMNDEYGISEKSFIYIYKEFKDNIKKFGDIMAGYVVQYIDILFCNFDPRNPDKVDDFSRHKLSHGFSSNYHSEVNSLRLILYLDEIYNIIEKLSMEKMAI